MLAISMPTERELEEVACQARFLEVERLVDRAVEVEHEMDAQAAHVLEDLEALPAGAADVEVEDELIDDPLEQRQVPAAAADALDLLRRSGRGCAGCSGRAPLEASDVRLRGLPGLACPSRWARTGVRRDRRRSRPGRSTTRPCVVVWKSWPQTTISSPRRGVFRRAWARARRPSREDPGTAKRRTPRFIIDSPDACCWSGGRRPPGRMTDRWALPTLEILFSRAPR